MTFNAKMGKRVVKFKPFILSVLESVEKKKKKLL